SSACDAGNVLSARVYRSCSRCPASRVGAMFNPDDPSDGIQILRLPAAARTVGVTIEVIEVRSLGNLESVATRLMRANVQGLFVGIARLGQIHLLQMRTL